MTTKEGDELETIVTENDIETLEELEMWDLVNLAKEIFRKE